MKISELAAATDTPVDTIRYYEREGLLPPPARADNNYRHYDAAPRNYVNDEDFAIQGLEYQFKWRPWAGAQFIFNQAYTDINAVFVPGGNTTPFAAPKHASTLVYFQKFSNGLDFTLSHQDSSTAALTGAGMDSLQAFTRTDMRLGWPLRWGARTGEVAVTVQNLGSPYQDYYIGHEFKRRAFVTLRLEN